MSIEIHTFGCRLNAYESEVMREQAQQAALQDTVIVNTCAVTAEAERQARQAIRRARRQRPGARIIVTGCAAQINPQSFGAMDEVDVVLGNEEKLASATWKQEAGKPPAEAGLRMPDVEKIRVNDIMSVSETASHLISAFDGHTRAFVQVQNGCNHRCTFCIIPYGRGNSRSVPMGEVVSQVRALVAQGYHEVVLTGVDISSYGEDLPGTPRLGQLCRRLLKAVPELPRLRLSSIDAVEVDAELERLIAEEPRLMPHLHLSLQAGDDLILKRMKRRHLRRDAIDFCTRLRHLRPDIVFGADLIAGFPTETEAMFQRSLDLVEEAGLTYLHVFPYSEREGTPAARMPAVPKPVRKERAARLREAGAKRERALYEASIGKTVQLLMEKDGIGRSEQFIPVRVQGPQPGALRMVAISALEDSYLKGNVIPAKNGHPEPYVTG